MKPTDHVTCIPLWDCLLVPLSGDVTDEHADNLVAEILERIERDACVGVLVDLSGVWTLDSHLCAIVVRLALSARMMGAETVLSGMSPDIAMTLEAMGFDPQGLRTLATLEDALASMGITRGAALREGGELPSLANDDDLLIQYMLAEAPR